jgi:hypothetical protein
MQSKTRSEVSSLFWAKYTNKGKDKKTNTSWKRKFFCFAHYKQHAIPKKDIEKDVLQQAGLGDAEIFFEDIHISSDEFREIIYSSFPLLTSGGRYLSYRCTNRHSGLLELLSPFTLLSPSALNTKIGGLKTFIKPLQNDLDTNPINELSEGVHTCICIVVI